MVADELDRFLKNHWHLFAIIGIFGTVSLYLITISDTTGDASTNSALSVGIVSSLSLAIITGCLLIWKSIKWGSRQNKVTQWVFKIYNILIASLLLGIFISILRFPQPVKRISGAIFLIGSGAVSIYLLIMTLKRIQNNVNKQSHQGILSLLFLFIVLLTILIIEPYTTRLSMEYWFQSESLDTDLLINGYLWFTFLGVFVATFLMILAESLYNLYLIVNYVLRSSPWR